MIKYSSIILTILFLTTGLISIGCAPSPEKVYESKMKEKESQDLNEKITELEMEVEELKAKLETCEEDFRNLLYYNREKENIQQRLEELEKGSDKKEAR
jgi:hypothetical protein